MRTRPLVGTKLWFVPRDDGWGWGWRSASWEGHVVFAASVIAMLVAAFALDGIVAAVVAGAGVAALLTAGALKGTTPGGRRQAAQAAARKGGG